MELIDACIKIGYALGEVAVKLGNIYEKEELEGMITTLSNIEDDPTPHITNAVIEIIKYAIDLKG